jgi:hypothetical protein
MRFIAGLFYLAIGAIFLLAAGTIARRQGMGTAVCMVLWGLFASTFGVLDFAEEFGHPLMSPDVRFAVFVAFALLCLPSCFLIRSPKK